MGVSIVYHDGGAGGVEPARHVRDGVESESADLQRVDDLDDSLPEKIRTVATRVSGVDDAEFAWCPTGETEADVSRF